MQTSIVDIQYLGLLGDGVHVGEKERVFIERALPKERVRIETHRDKMGHLRGQVTEVFDASPNRQTPPCRHFEVCGNCSLQHFNPEFYAKWKIHTVKKILFEKKLVPKKWLDPVFVPQGDRRRVTFSAQKKDGILKVGYYRIRSKEISEIDSCLITHPKVFGLRTKLKELLKELIFTDMPVDVSLQLVGESIDMLFTGPIGKKSRLEKSDEDLFLQFATENHIQRISWRESDFGEIKKIVQLGPVIKKIGEIQVKLPPDAFLQPTLQGEKALVEGVLSLLPEQGHFADLFSGCGTFAGEMIGKGSVDAFEWEKSSVQALKACEGPSLAVHRRDLFSYPLTRQELGAYDAVVFDPPRAGCIKQAEEMARSKVPLLIGISCNPANFAKDAYVLCRGGYQLESVQLIDQFLWSAHVELLAVFRKNKK